MGLGSLSAAGLRHGTGGAGGCEGWRGGRGERGRSCGPSGPISPPPPDTVGRGRDLLPARDAEWFSASAQAARKKTPDQRVLQVGGFSWAEVTSLPGTSPDQATRLGSLRNKGSPVSSRAVSPQPDGLFPGQGLGLSPSNPGFSGGGPISASYGSLGTSPRSRRSI